MNVQSLLAGSRRARDARKVKWIGAIQSSASMRRSQDDAITIDFRVHTDPDGLTDADLPIAPGADAPAMVERPGEIGIGVRDIGQIVGFVETVAQAMDPSGFGDYVEAKARLEKKLDVDLEKDLLDQLSGDISASVSLSGDFGVRVEPEDPPPSSARSRRSPRAALLVKGRAWARCPSSGPRAARISTRWPGPTVTSVVFGVKSGVFVLANDASRAGEPGAPRSPPQAAGARARSWSKADAERLAASCSRRLGDPSASRAGYEAPDAARSAS